MPMHNGWLPREGFTVDVLGRIIKKTLFNPALTLPLILLARYTKRGENLSILHETAFKRIKLLLALGLIRWASNYLEKGSLNNWVDDKYDWKKEIVLITGGSGGIGGQVVKLLAERGIKVVILDVIPMTYEAGPNVFYFNCDITSPSALSTVAQEIRSHPELGSPTVIINNAGVCRGKSILDSTEKDVRFTFDVNSVAHYFIAKEFVPSMIEKNHGMVVTISSLAGFLTAPMMVDYAASKAAAHAFHEGLASELVTKYNAPKVRTVVVNISYTKTKLFQGFGQGNQFFTPTLEPDTVAEALVKKILSGTSGQIILPGMGIPVTMLRGFPWWMQNHARNNASHLMNNWQGRQVIDVEEKYDVKKA